MKAILILAVAMTSFGFMNSAHAICPLQLSKQLLLSDKKQNANDLVSNSQTNNSTTEDSSQAVKIGK